jgi:polyisoprenyl-phosphate glycosyltransferase
MSSEKSPVIDISVIIPIYNEEKIIPELFDRLKKTLCVISEAFEVIFINDGSSDNSLAELLKLSQADKRVFYINFSRNFGHQIAVTAGLDFCRGKATVLIDGDLQDPPELITDLYNKMKEGYEVVYAQRKRREGESVFKKLTAKIFYRIMHKYTSVHIPVDTGDFRIMDRKIVDYLKKMPEQSKFIRGQVAWLGFRQTSVLYTRDKRKHGSTSYTLGKMIYFAMNGITGFSDIPIRLVTSAGTIISLIAFVIILWAVFVHFVEHRTITGWTSLMVSTMFIGGIQLFSIGIIGEYIGRINRNVLNRPLYIIDNTNLKVDIAEEEVREK